MTQTIEAIRNITARSDFQERERLRSKVPARFPVGSLGASLLTLEAGLELKT